MAKEPKICPAHQYNPKHWRCTWKFIGCALAKKKPGAKEPIKFPPDIDNLDVSRQRKLQLLWQRQGLCIICAQPRGDVSTRFCLRHLILTREHQRKKDGHVRRNFGAKSYVAEKKFKEKE